MNPYLCYGHQVCWDGPAGGFGGYEPGWDQGMLGALGLVVLSIFIYWQGRSA